MDRVEAIPGRFQWIDPPERGRRKEKRAARRGQDVGRAEPLQVEAAIVQEPEQNAQLALARVARTPAGRELERRPRLVPADSQNLTSDWMTSSVT